MKFVYKIEEFIMGSFLLVSITVLMSHIFLRYFFKGGFPWTEELIRFMFVWVTFIGTAILVRKAGNIAIDVVPNLLKGMASKIHQIIVIIITLVLAVILGIYGMELVNFNLERSQYSHALQLPMYYVYISIPIGALLMIIHAIKELINILKVKGKE